MRAHTASRRSTSASRPRRHLAWITLSNGAFHSSGAGSAITDPPLAVTQAIDMVVAIDARSDVDDAEKAALGRALLYVLE